MRYVAMRHSSFVLVILIALSSAASPMTPDKRRSDLLAAFSLASETELFIGQILDHRLLPHFQSGHADYLRQEAEHLAKDTGKSSRDDKVLAICTEQLQMLVG